MFSIATNSRCVLPTCPFGPLPIFHQYSRHHVGYGTVVHVPGRERETASSHGRREGGQTPEVCAEGGVRGGGKI